MMIYRLLSRLEVLIGEDTACHIGRVNMRCTSPEGLYSDVQCINNEKLEQK